MARKETWRDVPQVDGGYRQKRQYIKYVPVERLKKEAKAWDHAKQKLSGYTTTPEHAVALINTHLGKKVSLKRLQDAVTNGTVPNTNGQIKLTDALAFYNIGGVNKAQQQLQKHHV